MIMMCAQAQAGLNKYVYIICLCMHTVQTCQAYDTRKQMQETEEQTSNRTCVTAKDDTTVSSEDRTEER